MLPLCARTVAALLGLAVVLSPATAGATGAPRFLGARVSRTTAATAAPLLARAEAARAEARAAAPARSAPGGGPTLDAWTTNGFPVTATGFGQLTPVLASDGANGAFVAWLDALTPRFGVDVTRINSTGDVHASWPANGLVAASHDSIAFDLRIAGDGAGGAFVGFSELFQYTGGLHDIHIQHLTGAGALASGWTLAGKTLSVGEIYEFGLSSDGGTGLLLHWIDSNFQPWVLRLDADGNGVSGWPAGGIPVGPASPVAYDAVPDGTGGFFAAWASGDSVLCTRYAANGAVAAGWSAAGATTAAGSFFTDEVALARLTSGDLMVGWTDDRFGDVDVFAARLDAGGGFATGWSLNGVAVCTATGYAYDLGAIADPAGGALFHWIDERTTTAAYYAQRITGGGALAASWPVDGVPLCSPSGDKTTTPFVGDGSGGLYAVWTADPSSSGSFDIYAQSIQSDATRPLAYPAPGLLVCNAPDEQYDLALVTDGAGGAIYAWSDDRAPLAPARAYIARINATGTPAQAALTGAVAEPDRVTLAWFSPDGSAFAAMLERARENDGFAPIATLGADASGMLGYVDRDVVPGATYRYRLVVTAGGSRAILGEATVRVPESLALALEAARPNPSAGAVTFAFTLAAAAPATLELIDVAGRSVLRREVGGAAGRQLARIDDPLPPGLYVVRLEQSGRAVTSRIAVTR